MVHLARATFACLFCLPACAQVFSIASPKPYILVGESFTLTPFLRDPAGIQIVVGDWVWTALDPAILALREHEVMVLMLEIGQAFSQVAGVVTVDIRKGGHAKRSLLSFQSRRLEFMPEHVAHGFGAILISLLVDEFVELRSEFFAKGNSEAIHVDILLIVLGEMLPKNVGSMMSCRQDFN